MNWLLLAFLSAHRSNYLAMLGAAHRAGVPRATLVADVCALATEAGHALGTTQGTVHG